MRLRGNSLWVQAGLSGNNVSYIGRQHLYASRVSRIIVVTGSCEMQKEMSIPTQTVLDSFVTTTNQIYFLI